MELARPGSNPDVRKKIPLTGSARVREFFRDQKPVSLSLNEIRRGPSYLHSHFYDKIVPKFGIFTQSLGFKDTHIIGRDS